jgi:hypothetical protein
MWRYLQKTGELFSPSGEIVGSGYAGKGNATNDPDQQCVTDMGPIPRGFYTILPAMTHPRLGNIALPLKPDDNNEMCGRSDFFIHGDSVSDPGNASKGCIIMNHTVRRMVSVSIDKRLRVVRQSPLSGVHEIRIDRVEPRG